MGQTLQFVVSQARARKRIPRSKPVPGDVGFQPILRRVAKTAQTLEGGKAASRGSIGGTLAGFGSTIRTSGLGLTTVAPTGKKTLLGQGGLR